MLRPVTALEDGRMWRLLLCSLPIIALLAACGAPSPTETDASSPPSDVAAAEQTTSPTVESTPSPEASASAEPRALFGTWRTTLGGQNLTLNITESTYRIVRGPNAANGSVTVTGEEIEFFDSDLCPGSGFYRWAISDAGALSFFPVESEPCPGRAEALLVAYPDYSPPSGN